MILLCQCFLQTLVATVCGVAIARVYIIMLGIDGGGLS